MKAATIAAYFASCWAALEELTFSAGLDDGGLLALAAAAPLAPPLLSRLAVSGRCGATATGTAALAAARWAASLESLDLDGQPLDAAGACALVAPPALALRAFPDLKVLDVSQNRIMRGMPWLVAARGHWAPALEALAPNGDAADAAHESDSYDSRSDSPETSGSGGDSCSSKETGASCASSDSGGDVDPAVAPRLRGAALAALRTLARSEFGSDAALAAAAATTAASGDRLAALLAGPGASTVEARAAAVGAARALGALLRGGRGPEAAAAARQALARAGVADAAVEVFAAAADAVAEEEKRREVEEEFAPAEEGDKGA